MSSNYYKNLEYKIDTLKKNFNTLEDSDFYLQLIDVQKTNLQIYEYVSKTNLYTHKKYIASIIYFLKNFYQNNDIKKEYTQILNKLNTLIRNFEKGGKRIKKLKKINDNYVLDRTLNIIIKIDNG